MNGDRTDYILRSIDRQINELRAQGKKVDHIEMTTGAREMLRLRFFPESRKPQPDGGIFRYCGYPVQTAQLDVPAIVHAKHRPK